MATIVKCPYCGSINTTKTSNGKLTDKLAKAGAVVGGAILEMAKQLNVNLAFTADTTAAK